MSKRNRWDRRLSVTADGRGLIGHAGVVLLHKMADKSGLTGALASLWPVGLSATWRDRAHAVIGLASAIVLGARNMLDAERLQAHHQALFGVPPSDSTLRRTLETMDEPMRERIARARARVRRHIWQLLHLRPGGFPWLQVAGKRLTGWIVIDIDATVITSTSKKSGAAVTFKKTFGLHPLAAWCANTQESLELLRPGNAGSNTVEDHLRVLAAALKQIPGSSAAKILVRIDGAGATHELLEHLQALNTTRRTVRFLVGSAITAADEAAIAKLPATAWDSCLTQDGRPHPDGYQVAELTALSTRPGWPKGLRLLVRRVKPAGRHHKKLTDFEKTTGWRYQTTATDITRMWGIAGSHHPQWLDVLGREHAVVEDRVRVAKAMGLDNLPSKDWTVNYGWTLVAALGHDLDCWVRLLTLHDHPDLAKAEPDTMRYRLYHLPARLARRRWLRLGPTWPWAHAFVSAWDRLARLPILA
ncbi:IS1380 family transposase [Nonomuraea sp. NPDC050310]|uniref:IS1380 family transposase n=1 Tax=Nonomuraea sp. NPDC050310 TaxID=3154935 RepID=UPI0033CD6D16